MTKECIRQLRSYSIVDRIIDQILRGAGVQSHGQCGSFITGRSPLSSGSCTNRKGQWAGTQAAYRGRDPRGPSDKPFGDIHSLDAPLSQSLLAGSSLKRNVRYSAIHQQAQRAYKEDALLALEFGAEFEAYRQRTGRLMPRLN
jgi:hypothetical protein